MSLAGFGKEAERFSDLDDAALGRLVPHGDYRHRCHDADPACVEAAVARGRARFAEQDECIHDRLLYHREHGQDAPNLACGCPRCMPDEKGEL